MSAEIKLLLVKELESLGFKKFKSLMIRGRNQVWDIIKIQKSRSGDEYFVRGGFFLPEISPDTMPNVIDPYHADCIPPIFEESESWRQALLVGSNVDLATRAQAIHLALSTKIIPTFERFRTIEDFALELSRIDALGKIKYFRETPGSHLLVRTVLSDYIRQLGQTREGQL